MSFLPLQKESFVAGKHSLIHAPSHYVEGRHIQPCEVMESWGLVQHHYIACAFKYLARAGRKGDPCQDLNKALWYLDRFDQIGASLKNLVVKGAIMPEDLCLDWHIAPDSLRGKAFQEMYDLACGTQISVDRLKSLLCLERKDLKMEASSILPDGQKIGSWAKKGFKFSDDVRVNQEKFLEGLLNFFQEESSKTTA